MKVEGIFKTALRFFVKLFLLCLKINGRKIWKKCVTTRYWKCKASISYIYIYIYIYIYTHTHTHTYTRICLHKAYQTVLLKIRHV